MVIDGLGTIEYLTGPVMAAADRFDITVQGAGGHGASPHQTKDAIAIGSQLVMNLQQLVSRRVNPIESAVLSVGSFIADNAFNVIADSAKLGGTVRTFNPEIRDLMEIEMKRVVDGTALANDCTIEFEYVRGYPAVVNHEAETEFLKTVAEKYSGVERSRRNKTTYGRRRLRILFRKSTRHIFLHRCKTGKSISTSSSKIRFR